MFGRHFELKVVKTKKSATPDNSKNESTIDYAAIAEDLGIKLVVGIVTIMAANFAFKTAEHLIVNRKS